MVEGMTNQEAIDKYLFTQSRYPCCQLVAAINARIIQGSSFSEDEFEELVDMAGCRNGSALKTGMEIGFERLGITCVDGLFELEWIRDNLPIEINISDIETYDQHVVLIVGVAGNMLFVHNMDKLGDNPFNFEFVKKLHERTAPPIRVCCALQW